MKNKNLMESKLYSFGGVDPLAVDLKIRKIHSFDDDSAQHFNVVSVKKV
jgi:hypothetical protein